MKNYTEINLKNHKNTTYFDKYFIGVLILIFFHFLMNVCWILHNNVPTNWDPSIHIMNTYNYANYFVNSLGHFNIVDFLKISNYYPIFVYIISIPLAFISAGNYKIILLSGSLFFSIAILFLYLYSSELFNNKKIGFLTVFIFSFFITIYQASRDHMLDIPLTSLMLVSLFCLEKFRQKNNVRYLYLFFLFFSFAELTKWYAFVYISIPVLFFLYDRLKKKKPLFFIQIMKGLFVFIIITLPWYFVNFDTFLGKSSRAWFGEVVTKTNLLSPEFLLSHLKLIILFQVNFFGFLLLLISIYLIFRSKSYRKHEIIAVLIFNYIFFTLVPNRNIRYLIPLMPFIALVMGYGSKCLLETKKTLASFVVCFLLFYYMLSYFILSFGIPIYPSYKYSVRFPIINWIDIYYLADYPVKVIYDENTWPQKKIISDISSLTHENTSLFLCSDRYLLNADNFNLAMMTSDVKNIKLSSYYQLQDMPVFLKDYEFVLIPKYNVIGEEKNYVSYKPLLAFQTYFLSGKAKEYELIKQYTLPRSQSLIDDTDVLYLYRKR